LRRTAFPSAFFMLQPNRLRSRPLGRRNTVNSRLVRRRPSRYTASYSLRRTNRASRGNSSRGGSDAREAVASLLAASCKDFPSTLSLHPFAKSVLLMPAPHMRLKCPLRQRQSPESPYRAVHPENRQCRFEGLSYFVIPSAARDLSSGPSTIRSRRDNRSIRKSLWSAAARRRFSRARRASRSQRCPQRESRASVTPPQIPRPIETISLDDQATTVKESPLGLLPRSRIPIAPRAISPHGTIQSGSAGACSRRSGAKLASRAVNKTPARSSAAFFDRCPSRRATAIRCRKLPPGGTRCPNPCDSQF
jgi:hypothetical protein